MDTRLLMVGPGLQVRGGITSVERLILANLPSGIRAQHIATMVDGSKFLKLWTFLKCLVLFERALRSRVDVVHIHFSIRSSSIRKELLARRALLSNRKVIMHAHGSEYRSYWNSMTSSQQNRTRHVLTRISALIVLGEVWREFFESIGVPNDRIVVMPNPVSLPERVPDRHGRKRVRFVHLGIIGKRKGAFDLLDAICRLPPNVRKTCRFTFAGNGEVARLRSLVADNSLTETVEVRDWIDDRQRDELLADSDVFVLPSYDEGMPMALLEAMAWGLPVISTPVGSIPEVVSDDHNGLVVDPGDVRSLAAAIELLVLDAKKRLALGHAARLSVEPLSASRYIAELGNVYARVMRP